MAKCVFAKDLDAGLVADRLAFSRAAAKLSALDPDVVIITASRDRLRFLKRLWASIRSQRTRASIAWIVVDNGSCDGTPRALISQLESSERVIPVVYSAAFGYAAPARNRGLAFFLMASDRRRSRYLWFIDSDDYLHNEFVLENLLCNARRRRSAVTHGFAVAIYEGACGGSDVRSTIPREIDYRFPRVPSLKDELEMGPQILAGLIDAEFASRLYYPDEFTMEDDAMNLRMMTCSLNEGWKVVALDFPCLVKTFHEESMSGVNSKVGDASIAEALGPQLVTGVRAQVVRGLRHCRDYFTREQI